MLPLGRHAATRPPHAAAQCIQWAGAAQSSPCGKVLVCDGMKGPGRRPVWHDSYTIDGVPLEQPLTLTITAYDVSNTGNTPIGAQQP